MVGGTDRATLVGAVAGEGWPIDLAGAVVDDGGWENVVLRTGDGWILRFPRWPDLPFDREVALLRRLRARLPVPIPDVTWTGGAVRVAAYRGLVGAPFDPAAYASAPASARDRLAGSLADFLVAMHGALSDDEIAELGVPDVDHAGIHDLVATRIGTVPAECRAAVAPAVAAYAETWVAGTVAGPRALLHNDFHRLNMVFDPADGRLAGIWDFTCVLMGVPTFDLRYFDAEPSDILDRLARHYTARTGSPIDVRAAIVANRMENIHDALSTGRTELLYRALRRWAAADSRA